MGRPRAVPGAFGTRHSRKRRIRAAMDRRHARRHLPEIRHEAAASANAPLSPRQSDAKSSRRPKRPVIAATQPATETHPLRALLSPQVRRHFSRHPSPAHHPLGRVHEGVETLIEACLEPRRDERTCRYAEALHVDHPLLFVVTPGAEPTDEIRTLARSSAALPLEISISPGSEEQSISETVRSAREGMTHGSVHFLAECWRTGTWILIKNIHLSRDFVHWLDGEFGHCAKRAGFQLFLTTEDVEGLSTRILQTCTKVTSRTRSDDAWMRCLQVVCQAPPGFRQNFVHSCRTLMRQPSIDATEPVPSMRYASLVAVLSWLHAVVQTRREAGAWRRAYVFSSSDLHVAMWLAKPDARQPLRWEIIRGVLQTVVYGAVIDEASDVQVSISRVHFDGDSLDHTRSSKPASSASWIRAFSRSTMCMETDCSVCCLDPSLTTGRCWRLLDQWSTDGVVPFVELTVGAKGQHPIQRTTDVVRDLRRLKGPSQKPSPFCREHSRSHVMCEHTEAAAAAAVIEAAEEKLATIESLLSHLDARHLSNAENGVLDSCLLKDVDFARTLAARVRQTVRRARAAKETLVFASLPSGGALALMQNRLPSAWTAVWDGGPSAGDVASYLNAVAQRVQYLHQRYASAQRLCVGDGPRLGRLFRPQLLLGCIKRQTAKTLRVPFDRLSVDVKWHPRETPSELQILVVGLKLEGAQFDGQRLLPFAEVRRHRFLSQFADRCSDALGRGRCLFASALPAFVGPLPRRCGARGRSRARRGKALTGGGAFEY